MEKNAQPFPSIAVRILPREIHIYLSESDGRDIEQILVLAGGINVTVQENLKFESLVNGSPFTVRLCPVKPQLAMQRGKSLLHAKTKIRMLSTMSKAQ